MVPAKQCSRNHQQRCTGLFCYVCFTANPMCPSNCRLFVHLPHAFECLLCAFAALSQTCKCRLLQSVINPTTGGLEPWFRPVASEVDHALLRSAHWGSFFVSNAPDVLGGFALHLLRPRRGHNDTRGHLFTARQPVRSSTACNAIDMDFGACTAALCQVKEHLCTT
jgi:hypothetical protein